MGIFDKGVAKTKQNFFQKLSRAVVGKSRVDDDVLDAIEEALVSSDMGVDTTLKIIDNLEERVGRDKYMSFDELVGILREEISSLIDLDGTEEVVPFDFSKKPYVIMVVGVNGVGKTTLLTLLCGLKKARQGTVLSDGFIPYDRLPEFLQNQYFLPDEVAPVNSVAETWAKDCGKFWPGYDHSVFLELMSLFEVNPSLKMNAMSAGQLKKSYISFALSCRPRYLFLDEPTVGIDVQTRHNILEYLKTLNSKGTTLIYTSHYLNEAETLCDHVALIDKGRIACVGEPADLISRHGCSDLEDLFLKTTGTSIGNA